MTLGHLHPADDKELRDVDAYVRRQSVKLSPGDMVTVTVTRLNNNRLKFLSAKTHDANPLRDDEE